MTIFGGMWCPQLSLCSLWGPSYFGGTTGAAWGVLAYSVLYAGFFCLATEGLTSSDILQIAKAVLGSALSTLIALAGAFGSI